MTQQNEKEMEAGAHHGVPVQEDAPSTPAAGSVGARHGVPVLENGPNASGAMAPEPGVSPAVAAFRKGFLTGPQYELLLALGEEPKDYQRIMESLLVDLDPRRGLESHLVEQMAETFWRMRRAHRMRDGLALRSIQRKVQGEEMTTSMEASKIFEAVEPFQRLKEALSRRGQGPTAAEIDEFLKARKGDSSERMQEFIPILKSLREPMEEQERKAALREARKHLRPLMEIYENLAWRYGRKTERVHSPENLAALMAPEDTQSVYLQRLEDSHLRRMWRLINAFGKVRQGMLQKKDVKKVRAKPASV